MALEASTTQSPTDMTNVMSIEELEQLWDDDAAREFLFDSGQQDIGKPSLASYDATAPRAVGDDLQDPNQNMLQQSTILDENIDLDNHFPDIDFTDWQPDADYISHRFDLRPGVRDAYGRSYTIATDRDDDGDYDPALKNKRKRKSNAKRRGRPSQPDNGTDDNDGDEEEDVVEQGQFHEEPPALVLRFPDANWRHLYAVKVEANAAGTALQSIEAEEGYAFRPRTTSAASSEDADDAHLNHLGHPVARGCVLCKKLGQRCSLLDNELKWPCQDCKNGREQCVLVIPAARKLACLGCIEVRKKEKWLICSHLYEDDPSGPCRLCASRLQECHPRPDPAATYQRTYIDDAGQPRQNRRPTLPTGRLPKSCRQCQEAERTCSFDNGGDSRSCIACEMDGAECSWINLGAQLKQKSRKVPRKERVAQAESAYEARKADLCSRMNNPAAGSVQRQTKEPMGRIPQAPSRLTVPRPVRVRLQTLKTKFCHPMVFNYDDFDAVDECHFCKSAYFSIIGLEQRDVVVQQLPHGRGWQEVRDGHAAEGVQNTKVCIMCTFQRLQIIACAKHDMQRIEGWTTASFQKALEDLSSGQNKQTWCSICCNIARWECCVAQNGQSPIRLTGCGLAMCETCTVGLSSFDNDLDKLLNEVKDELSHARPLGLRADHDLLKKNGLLMKYIMDSTTTEQA